MTAPTTRRKSASAAGAPHAQAQSHGPPEQRHQTRARPTGEAPGPGTAARVEALPVQHPHAAGIDIGSRSHWVCVGFSADADSGSTREFPAHTDGLRANRLLRAGVRVYLYPGLLHAKVTAVDGVWAYLGTGNFDALSLRHNREFGVALSHGPLVAELEGRFLEPDLRPEWELREPLPVTAYEYVVEAVAGLFG